jgi:recombination protein RecT
MGELIKLNDFKQELNALHLKQVQNFFNDDPTKARKFMSAVVYSVQKTPKLLRCSKESLMQAFMSCAEYGLYPSNVSGEAFVIPYGDKAQFQLGYQGIITLLFRSGNIKSLYSEIIYTKDEFHCSLGLNQELTHNVNFFGDRGEAIGVYAVATLQSGEKLFKVLPKETVFKFREKSQSWNQPKEKQKFSPWHPNNDPEFTMWKKTAIKQLAKLLPKNTEVFSALGRDTEHDVTSSFVDVPDIEYLNAGEINALFTEGRGMGLSVDDVQAAFDTVGATDTEVTKPQAEEIRAIFIDHAKKSDSQPPQKPAEGEPPPAERMANKRQTDKLIKAINKAGKTIPDVIGKRSIDKLTEQEVLDLTASLEG